MSSPRVRSLSNRAFLPLVVALLVVAAAGTVLAYEPHFDPGTHFEQRTLSEWERQAYFDYRGTVGVENSAYPVGTTLESQEYYLRSVVTEFSGELVYTVRGGEGSLSLATETALVYRAVDADGETEYWRVSDPVASEEYSLQPGDSAAVPFAFAVSDLVGRLDALGEEMGQLPARTDDGIQVLVRTHLTGSVDGSPVNERGEYALGLAAERGVLTVTDPRLDSETFRTTGAVEVPTEYGILETTVAPTATGVSVLLILVLVVLRWRGVFVVSNPERERLGFEAQRRKHDDWITTGTVSAAALRGPRVRVASLTGLVDLAIDTDNRVLEDEARGSYFVRNDDLVYVYDPPEDPVDAEDEGSEASDTGEDATSGDDSGTDGDVTGSDGEAGGSDDEDATETDGDATGADEGVTDGDEVAEEESGSPGKTPTETPPPGKPEKSVSTDGGTENGIDK